MDRSFLFQPNVIEASRDFVCVRLSSYENDEESQFLKMFMRTRSGAQENSSFAILAPDGKTKVTGGGRSAGQSYTDAAEMAREMKKLANKYENKKPITQLPLTETVRLGLDIAAADSQPFVLIVAKDQEQQKEWEMDLAKLAWSNKFIGKFVYASTSNQEELAAICKGHSTKSAKQLGLLVFQPDQFGLTGTILAKQADASKFDEALSAGLKGFKRDAKVFSAHVRQGHEKGIYWETKNEVTDPEEAAARRRFKLRD